MIRQLVLWLLDFLRESLDDDLKQRVDEARSKAAALDAEHAQLLREVAASEQVNAALGRQRVLNMIERGKLEDAIQQDKAELARRKADRAGLSDADKLRLDV